MDEDLPEPESEKPRFLLPDGCKDLIDALRLQQQHAGEVELPDSGASSTPSDQPKALLASVTLPNPVTVRNLASALHLKPFQIIHALMQINVFASVNAQLGFDAASALCSRFGILAIKSA